MMTPDSKVITGYDSGVNANANMWSVHVDDIHVKAQRHVVRLREQHTQVRVSWFQDSSSLHMSRFFFFFFFVKPATTQSTY